MYKISKILAKRSKGIGRVKRSRNLLLKKRDAMFSGEGRTARL